MKTKNVTLYICSHCKKEYKRKHACVNHELICLKNPVNRRACFGCNHLKKKQAFAYYSTFNGGEMERKITLFHCEKINSFLYPPNVEAKGNAFDMGDDLNQPMLKYCKVSEPFMYEEADSHLL